DQKEVTGGEVEAVVPGNGEGIGPLDFVQHVGIAPRDFERAVGRARGHDDDFVYVRACGREATLERGLLVLYKHAQLERRLGASKRAGTSFHVEFGYVRFVCRGAGAARNSAAVAAIRSAGAVRAGEPSLRRQRHSPSAAVRARASTGRAVRSCAPLRFRSAVRFWPWQ